jgi:DNA-binding NarL/FixJ family response regulator
MTQQALQSLGVEVQDFSTVAACLATDIQADLVVLLPPTLQVMVILEEVAALRERHNLPVVVIASADPKREGNLVREMLRGGVNGYIPVHSTDLPTAIAALRFVKSGGNYAPLENLLLSPKDKGKEKAKTGPLTLTPRQLEVLDKLRQGKPNKLIAYELGMTESTAKVHIRCIMRRFNANNRTEAVYKAGQIGA